MGKRDVASTLWPLLAALGAGGCSLVNLSGDIEQAQCASHEDCEVLNDRTSSGFDPCVVWQCAESSYCERYPLDLDYDGFSPHTVEQDGEDYVCAEAASERDCDDDSDDSNPAEEERCDAVDNDCDSQIDEGQLEQSPAIASVFADGNAGGTSEVTFAVDPDSGTVAAAYGIVRGASAVAGFSTIASTLASGSEVRPLALPEGASGALSADSVGVGALGGERFAVAFVNDNGGQHVVAGVVRPGGGGLELDAPDGVLRRGLRCAASEPCAGNHETATGEAIVPIAPTVTPALAASGEDVLVVYARAAEGEGACAEPGVAAEAAPVLANLLRYDDEALTERAGAALELGSTSDRNVPAVLALPQLGDRRDLGFIVAFANAQGAIEVAHVLSQDGGLVRGDTLLAIEDPDLRFSDVALALGPGDDAARTVGVAMQADCAMAARVMFARVELRLESGELAGSLAGSPSKVGGDPNETRPAVAWSDARSAWLVVYRDGSGLRARALTDAGMLLGADSYELLRESDSGAAKLQLTSSPFAVPLADEAWFGAIAASERAEDTVLQTITLSSCP